ncbi:exodeoxyribonuclease III [Limosilactobacillus fastidiosus]|uniref:Exodeoxyribonuclease III n=1 Tax=Limosilactobacillus fastidiosus TaxID=2759855 RepID=A0A7W3TZ12_9LACO|nr:exodeoxyribonuclease III [Limosilactobacillus fastidiosus]MBB1085595.1 exodeoxyribonuclease III [Limosilactobacillus fastidiosus]MCD7086048.1 exodeoxyribonuclease III [Limosilactobacillus fastidiosus]MCD7114308.1 exodeoxyribonuclease III [Limosilactobacillus fastidiosus]MCD7116315.1 exodeoxyribonuclease III [Limosilactobacillus fastidiosus]
MKFVSWNVGGFKAILRHGFRETVTDLNADIFCVQRTRLQPGEIEFELPGYHQYWNYAERKGSAGTAVFAKEKPQKVTTGINNPEFDREGRTITLEYPNFYFVTTYVPFSGEKLQKLAERQKWDQAFLDYVRDLNSKKEVIIGGSMGVAYQPIDLAEPAENHHHAGFTTEERDDFGKLLDAGFTDTFRYQHPNKKGAYTWWSYRYDARARNVGWRLDYFLVSNALDSEIRDSSILTNITGSEHCPIELVASVNPD